MDPSRREQGREQGEGATATGASTIGAEEAGGERVRDGRGSRERSPDRSRDRDRDRYRDYDRRDADRDRERGRGRDGRDRDRDYYDRRGPERGRDRDRRDRYEDDRRRRSRSRDTYSRSRSPVNRPSRVESKKPTASQANSNRTWDGFQWVDKVNPATGLATQAGTGTTDAVPGMSGLPKDRRIYVGNLPEGTDTELLRTFCKRLE
jgi:hypothetical protein